MSYYKQEKLQEFKNRKMVLKVIEKLQANIAARMTSIEKKSTLLMLRKSQKRARQTEITTFRNMIKTLKTSRAEKKLLAPIANARLASESSLFMDIINTPLNTKLFNQFDKLSKLLNNPMFKGESEHQDFVEKRKLEMEESIAALDEQCKQLEIATEKKTQDEVISYREILAVWEMKKKRNEFLEQQEEDLIKRGKELEIEKLGLVASLQKIRDNRVIKCVTQADASPEPFYSQAYVDPPAVRNAANLNSLPAKKTTD